MVFNKKPEPLSYAEGPRLDRSLKPLSPEARQLFVSRFYEHVKKSTIHTVQRRGAALYFTLDEGKKRTVEVFDFGVVACAQSCLTALTDCFRSMGAPVQVLMPEAPPRAT